MSKVSHFFVYLCLPCLALCLALVAQAKNGRDFAGFYSLSNVSEQGDKVEFRMTVQVFNYSDLGDIKAPVIALREPGSTRSDTRELRDLQEFNAVKLMPAKHDVIVSGQFTVSKMEFESWKRHGSPQVVVIYEVSGRTLRQHAQLSRRPTSPPATTN